MTNYPQELAQDAVCQSHTGHMTVLWFLPTQPLRLNTNEWMNYKTYNTPCFFFNLCNAVTEFKTLYISSFCILKILNMLVKILSCSPFNICWLQNTAHAHCTLDTQGYKHLPRICYSYCFLLQQWFNERASVLRYTYISFLFSLIIFILPTLGPFRQGGGTSCPSPPTYAPCCYERYVNSKEIWR